MLLNHLKSQFETSKVEKIYSSHHTIKISSTAILTDNLKCLIHYDIDIVIINPPISSWTSYI